MKKNKGINILSIIFVFVILCQYTKLIPEFTYDLVVGVSIIYLYFFKQKKYKVFLTKTKGIYIILLSLIAIIHIGIKILDGVVILLVIRIFILIVIIYRIFSVFGEQYIYNFLRSFVKMMFFLNIISIFEYLNNTNLFYMFLSDSHQSWFPNVGETGFRISSVFMHPIIYGNILVINYAVLYNMKKYFRKNFYYINLILIIINIYGTQSRSSWITFCILLMFILALKIISDNKITKKSLGAIFIVLIVSISGIFVFKNQISDIVNKIEYRFSFEDGSSISKYQRLGAINNVYREVYENTWRLFIGSGLTSSKDFMLQNEVMLAGFISMDNQYLVYIYEFGLLFVLIYVIFLIKSIVDVFIFRTERTIIATTILIMVSINMFFYEITYWKIIIFFTILSIMVNNFEIKEKI